VRASRTICRFGGAAVAAAMCFVPMATTAFADAMSLNAQLQFAQNQPTTQLRMGDQNSQRCMDNCEQQAETCYRNAQGQAKENCEAAGTQCKRSCIH
jgi:hypothetical protein